jgi:hypothetical protein
MIANLQEFAEKLAAGGRAKIVEDQKRLEVIRKEQASKRSAGTSRS